MSGAAQPRRSSTVRMLVDAALLILLVGLSIQIASAAHRNVKRREKVQAISAEAKALYAAFQSYRERNGVYPDEHAAPPFDPATFEPLRRRGYYHGSIDSFLLNGRVDGYDAPDDQGPDHEFWMEMTLASDPSVRILIARSDNAPSSRGTWIDGVFVWRDGKLEQL